MIKLKFIDLFAGIGGTRIPFDELGYENVFASEFNRAACDTYETNFGHRPVGDITKIKEEDIPPMICCSRGSLARLSASWG